MNASGASVAITAMPILADLVKHPKFVDMIFTFPDISQTKSHIASIEYRRTIGVKAPRPTIDFR